MKFKEAIKLFEKYENTIFNGNEKYDIFENPSQKEIIITANKDIYNEPKQIRFIAHTRNKALYIFPTTVLHYEVAKKIKFNIKRADDLYGIANFIKGKLFFYKSLEVNYYFIDKDKKSLNIFKNTDYTWIDKYITTTTTSIFKKLKAKAEKF